MMCAPTSPMPQHYEATFVGVLRSAGEARRFTRLALAETGLPDSVVDDAVLAVDELAANAIEHTRSGDPGGKFTVRLELARTLHVEVVDQGADTAPAIAPDSAERGRGLLILSRLGELGDALTLTGRRVWCDLPLPSAVTSSDTTGGAR